LPVTAVKNSFEANGHTQMSEEALDILCRHLSLKKMSHSDADSWNQVCLTLIHYAETATVNCRGLKYANALYTAVDSLMRLDADRAAIHLAAARRLVERRLK